MAIVICSRWFRCCTSTSWTEVHFNFPTLVTWRSFLTSRAKALAGDAADQGAGLLVASDCALAPPPFFICGILLKHVYCMYTTAKCNRFFCIKFYSDRKMTMQNIWYVSKDSQWNHKLSRYVNCVITLLNTLLATGEKYFVLDVNCNFLHQHFIYHVDCSIVLLCGNDWSSFFNPDMWTSMFWSTLSLPNPNIGK